MAEQWIKITHVTPDKPEIFQIAEELDIDPDAVLGKLVRAWVWADQQTLDGKAPRITKILLDRVTVQRGFADACIAAGWLEDGADGLQFSNFERHNGKTAKKRALNNRYVSEHRQKKGSGKEDVSKSVRDKTLQTAVPDEDEDEDISTTTTAAVKESPMSPYWEPSADTLQAIRTLHSVPPDFINHSIAEFRAYWLERGDSKASWNSKFMNSCVTQWRKHGHEWTSGKSKKAGTRSRSLADDLNDRSWAGVVEEDASEQEN